MQGRGYGPRRTDTILAFRGKLDDSTACDLLREEQQVNVGVVWTGLRGYLHNRDVGNRNAITLKITDEPLAILSNGADKADGSPCASDGSGLICSLSASATLKLCGRDGLSRANDVADYVAGSYRAYMWTRRWKVKLAYRRRIRRCLERLIY